MIITKELTKTFRRFQKEPGLRNSVKSLFEREYVDTVAVDNFDLTVERGEFLGLIGPNGAGKTTLVKMLTGIIAPSSGEISVLGYYPNKLENAFKKRYAVVMGQKSQLFFELTPADTFQLFQTLYDIPKEVFRKNVETFVELFEVSKFLNVQVRTLSLGERMKMELIVALLHNPEILFLDEPTIGLDAAAQKQIRLFLKEVNTRKKTTIILTSHNMEDVRSLCPRSIVISKGSKIYDGDTNRLFNAYQTHKKITLSFEEPIDIALPIEAATMEQTPHKVVFMISKDQCSNAVTTLMNQHNSVDILSRKRISAPWSKGFMRGVTYEKIHRGSEYVFQNTDDLSIRRVHEHARAVGSYIVFLDYLECGLCSARNGGRFHISGNDFLLRHLFLFIIS